MLISLGQSKKGFTLIELLVVIAIIAMLSAIVLASLSTSRAKGRDARRISDVSEIQTALELYYDGSRSYPSTTPAGFAGTDATVQMIAGAPFNFLKQRPIPPAGGSPLYIYKGVYLAAGVRTECTTIGGTCSAYSLGITLERSDNPVLRADADQTLGAVFYGDSQDCLSPATSAELCYDVMK